MGETAIAETIIHPIKQQEPGHFAFYKMSAEKMVQDEELKPWQVQVARLLRSKSFTMVGVDYVKYYQQEFGGVMAELGIDAEIEIYAARDRAPRGEAAVGQREGHGLPALLPQGAARVGRDVSRQQELRGPRAPTSSSCRSDWHAPERLG